MSSTYAVYALSPGSRATDWSTRLYGYPPGEGTRSVYFFWVLMGEGGPIVVDTAFTPRLASVKRLTVDDARTRGSLLAGLDVDPDAVPTLIVTHLHWDHFDLEGDFPAATVWIQRRELEFWRRYGAREPWHQRGLSDTFASDIAAVDAAGRLRLVDDRAEPVDGVRLE